MMLPIVNRNPRQNSNRKGLRGFNRCVVNHIGVHQPSIRDTLNHGLDRGLVTSRSIEKQSGDSRLVKKIDVKIGVVERAIYSIGRDTEVSSNGDRLMLEKFLNTDE